MAITKRATFSYKCPVKALNKPTGKGWEIFNFPNQIKTASIKVEDEDLGGFDLKEATKKHPDHLYIKVFAIKKDEPNDNGDAFNEEELKLASHTFVGVPLFTNHQNDDVEKARGECVHSWYDEKDGGIYIIGRVDKVAYPKLARGVEEGYISGTSMGCSVDFSLCSVCHNMAHTADQYCSHIKNGKNRKYSGDIKCKYHDSDTNEKKDKCPICGSTKDKTETLKHAEQQIYEHNYGLKFIENSFVVNPACHDCGVRCVLHVPEMSKKVASLNDTLSKIITASNEDSEFFEENAENIMKLGGVQELESLKNSMVEMETVVNSMLKQKENVSMEYVSDLVKAMADIQNIYDELIEMGYGALPSPSVTASGVDDVDMGVEKSSVPQGAYTAQPSAPSPSPPSPKTTGIEGQPQVSDLGGLGTATLPKKSSKKIEDFLNNSKNIMNKISSLENNIKNLINSDNIGVKMSTENKTQKVAAGSDNLEVITEKQLEKKNTDLHPRTDEVYEGITESKEQIAGNEKSNDTTSSSPQVRLGTYETITEDQLKTESAFGSSVIHFSEYPDVITEKQWNEFSRDVAADISENYVESITQAQIRDLLSKHKFIGNVETITEDQLKNMSMTDGLKRWANKDYSINLVKSAMNVVSDLISVYHKSPEEIKKISLALSDDMSKRQKAAHLVIINSLPKRKEERRSLASKSLYFNKMASKEVVPSIDAFILSASEHGKTGMKAEDLFDFVDKIVNDKKAMEKVNKIVKAKQNLEEEISLSSKDAFASALKEIEKPEDGKYRVYAKVDEVGVPLTKKAEFLNGVKKIAQEAISDDSVASAVIKVEVTDNGDLIIDIQDTNIAEAEEVSVEDFGDIIEDEIPEEVGADLHGEECPFEEEEKEEKEDSSDCGPKVVAQKDNKIKKEAQMMGGEMGGQGGVSQAPGAGATLPGVPGEEPPMESFTDEDMGDEFGDEDMGENLGAMPPGSICPVCGSEDVDIVAGKGKCNNCSSEMTFKVEINVTKWQGVTADDEREEIDEDFEGEGFEMPEEGDMGDMGGMGEMGDMPAVAAYTRLKPEALKKLASSKIELGNISPLTGKSNTVKLDNGKYACLDTGVKYKVSFVMDKKDPKKGAFAQWEWTPKMSGMDCPSCIRNKQRFIKALASVKMTEDKFNELSIKEQADTIIKLKKAGALKEIKTASKNSSVLSEYKLAYGNWGGSFPVESCIEKLTRRFGENAVCLSGPDEGRPLAESICNRLKKADVYSDKIAIKLAEGWSDCDGDEECITYQVRLGYNLREASTICESLKIAVAQAEDFLADEIEEDSFSEDIPVDVTDNEIVDDSIDEVDPFEEGSLDSETVTLELPKDVVEQLGQEVDMALEETEVPSEEITEEPLEDVTEEPLEGPTAEEMIDEEISGEPVEEVSPEDIGETAECTEFKQDSGLDKDKKVTINVNGSPVGGEVKSVEEGEEDIMEETLANENEYNYKEAQEMKSKFGKTGKIGLDLSTVIASLEKKAGEKQVTQEKAQDSKDIGQYSAGEGGSLIGHENETIRTPQKPSVPRSEATMGQEPSDLNPKDKPQPVIPSENATMGHEDEAGLSGGDNRYTGGTDGQGKTELASTDDDLYHMKGFGSSRKSLEGLAKKIADKLDPKKPVADDKDIQPISGSDGSAIGGESKFTAEDPEENVEGSSTESLMGHEKDTIEKAPKSPEDHPDVNTGNAQMGKEELDSEKTTKNKGTVIANNDSESEAIRVAGLMLQTKKIEASELYSKIKELKQYKPEQIRDFEKAIFASQKGLDSVSDGISQSIQINENSSIKNASDELTEKLQGLFTLGKRNSLADQDELTQVRKVYGK